MDELAARWDICAWKTYTQFGPGGRGYFLSDEPGLAMIEKARALGVKVVCVHKGLPFGPQSYEHSQCSDIGKVAKQFPDVAFIVYHSGFVAGNPELAYDHAAARDGIDTLVRSVLDNGIAPNSNVYAELGSTWRFLMREPDSAAHALGKLFKYVGRGQRAVGHRFDLVRLAAGSDSGVPHVSDRTAAARSARLPGTDERVAGEGVRLQRHRAVQDLGRRSRSCDAAPTRSLGRAPPIRNGATRTI